MYNPVQAPKPKPEPYNKVNEVTKKKYDDDFTNSNWNPPNFNIYKVKNTELKNKQSLNPNNKPFKPSFNPQATIFVPTSTEAPKEAPAPAQAPAPAPPAPDKIAVFFEKTSHKEEDIKSFKTLLGDLKSSREKEPSAPISDDLFDKIAKLAICQVKEITELKYCSNFEIVSREIVESKENVQKNNNKNYNRKNTNYNMDGNYNNRNYGGGYNRHNNNPHYDMSTWK